MHSEEPLESDMDVEVEDESDIDDEVERNIREIFGNDEDEDAVDEEDLDDPNINLWNSSGNGNSSNFREENGDELHHLYERRFIVGEQQLLKLIRLSTCEDCGAGIEINSIREGEKISAGVKYKFTCTNGHPGKWISTPFYGGRSLICLLLQLMVLLSGGSWEKFSIGAAFINLSVGSTRLFYTMQRQYRVAVDKFFHKYMAEVAKEVSGVPLSVGVDVRYDTPGFSANKSTAVFMDNQSQLILHLEIGDSREVGRHSPNMEKLLVKRGLDKMVYNSPFIVWEIISDASKTVMSLLETDRFRHLKHSLDIWHKAKKLAHNLGDIVKRAGGRELLPWVRPVINHFWYCCCTCKGDAERLIKRWFGILHHINNEHFWPGGRCHHEPCDSDDTGNFRKWLQKDSQAFQQLRKLVINRQWCGTLKYYTNCRQTWAIENFYSHTFLHYCPKQVSYSYDSYVLRNQLAVIDYNKHLSRQKMETKDGESYLKSQFSRKTKQWVAYEAKCNKTFSYIPELIALCMKETYGKPLNTYTKSVQAMALDQIAVNLSGGSNPGSKLLYTEMKSRKKFGLDASSRT